MEPEGSLRVHFQWNGKEDFTYGAFHRLEGIQRLTVRDACQLEVYTP